MGLSPLPASRSCFLLLLFFFSGLNSTESVFNFGLTPSVRPSTAAAFGSLWCARETEGWSKGRRAAAAPREETYETRGGGKGEKKTGLTVEIKCVSWVCVECGRFH